MSLLERLRSLFSSGPSSAPAAGDVAGPQSTPAAPTEPAEPPPPVCTRYLQAGQFVVKEGEPGHSMFIVLEGRVAVARKQAGSQEPVVLGELGAGEFFGELALLTGGARTASVVALEDAVVLEVSSAGVGEVLTDYGVEGDTLERAARERLMADALRSNPLLASMTPELRAQLATAFVPVTVPAGETLLTKGQPGNALYVLLRGECEVFHPHDDGRQSPLATLKEGALFGEISLLRSRLATATVRTLTPCTLLKLEREAFEKSILVQPGVRSALVRLGLERLKQTVKVIAEPPARGGKGS